MRKTLAILLAVIMVLSLAVTAFAQPPERPNVPGPKQSLVALGDSITAGYGLERNLNRVSRKAYPQLLGDEIGYRVTNLAVSGMTSCEVLEAVLYNNRYRNAIARADMIILNVGGADMLGFLAEFLNPYTPEPCPFDFITGLSSNIMSILGQIEVLNPDVPILLFNIYEPYPLAFILETEDYDSLLPLLAGVNAAIAGIAETNNLYFVDAYGYFDAFHESKYVKAGLLFVDEVHPSALGQVLLFEAAYDLLEGAGLLDTRPMPPGLAKTAAMAQ